MTPLCNFLKKNFKQFTFIVMKTTQRQKALIDSMNSLETIYAQDYNIRIQNIYRKYCNF